MGSVFHQLCPGDNGTLTPTAPTADRLLETIGDPWIFPAAFFPKYLIGCINHCCIVGGNHGIDVHVLIT